MTKFTGWGRVRIWHVISGPTLLEKLKEHFSLKFPKISHGDAWMQSECISPGTPFPFIQLASERSPELCSLPANSFFTVIREQSLTLTSVPLVEPETTQFGCTKEFSSHCVPSPSPAAGWKSSSSFHFAFLFQLSPLLHE